MSGASLWGTIGGTLIALFVLRVCLSDWLDHHYRWDPRWWLSWPLWSVGLIIGLMSGGVALALNEDELWQASVRPYIKGLDKQQFQVVHAHTVSRSGYKIRVVIVGRLADNSGWLLEAHESLGGTGKLEVGDRGIFYASERWERGPSTLLNGDLLDPALYRDKVPVEERYNLNYPLSEEYRK